MPSIDILLRITTLVLFFLRELYWKLLEQKADKEKPKIQTPTRRGSIEQIIFRITLLLLIFQLIGLQLFPFPHNSLIQFIGFIAVCISVVISILARKQLGVNWAHGKDYQIKKNQELITSGIYSYIRHPIYLGILLSYTGAEIVAHSYLSVIFFFIFFAGAYMQGKREEKILLGQFGKKYEEYMKRTKMLIPYLI